MSTEKQEAAFVELQAFECDVDSWLAKFRKTLCERDISEQEAISISVRLFGDVGQGVRYALAPEECARIYLSGRFPE